MADLSLIQFALVGLGLVLIVEGLVYALAPHIVEDLLRAMRDLPYEARRLIGLTAMVIGFLCLWIVL